MCDEVANDKVRNLGAPAGRRGRTGQCTCSQGVLARGCGSVLVPRSVCSEGNIFAT